VLFIGMALLHSLVNGVELFVDKWEIRQSPNTGLCYEVFTDWHPLSVTRNQTLIDAEFCK